MEKNYNYVFLFYDVGEKRVGKIFKICKKYLTHHQMSVFRGEITPSKIMALKREIKNLIEPNEDFVTIIKMYSRNNFEEESMGRSHKIDIDINDII
ncbi:CRISPR-associated endonuclease Cas2 [Peptoniphilus sp. MSJ-1]|uniref:CRISPR-associated endoribonuclease Cas2 n=1 Tax=Peptoniphilus ovalis TaxID=2841503 RepID=A0ABS6FE14_9FIRM|nr:CRISPR-associated endonuclease Cas2 [Peptoniphilus ovalis]MBU5668424.1 CRISPR-associated endonuclease Cas2 [Peptoniphilus ovalis]